MSGTARFNATADFRVVTGTCVVLTSSGELYYAGPIKGSPDEINGMTLLLSPEDFAKLQKHTLKYEARH